MILSSLINGVGDFLLVGVFGMGVAGAAIATIFAQIVSVIITFKLLARLEHAGGQIHVWHLHFCAEHMSMMIKIGFPLAQIQWDRR